MDAPAVVPLFGMGPCAAVGEPDPRVVAELEELLEAARRGEVHGVAFAVVDPAGKTWCYWAGRAFAGAMLQAVTRLFYRYCKADDEAG